VSSYSIGDRVRVLRDAVGFMAGGIGTIMKCPTPEDAYQTWKVQHDVTKKIAWVFLDELEPENTPVDERKKLEHLPLGSWAGKDL